MRTPKIFLLITVLASSLAAAAPVPMIVPPPGYTFQIPRDLGPKVRLRLMPTGMKLNYTSYAVIQVATRRTTQDLTYIAKSTMFAMFGWVPAGDKMPTMHEAAICGIKADTISSTMLVGRMHVAAMTLLLIRDGTLYTAQYIRTIDLPVDAAAQTWLSSFCPASPDAVRNMPPPRNWEDRTATVAQVTALGDWSNPNGSVVGLMRFDNGVSLASALKNLQLYMSGNNPLLGIVDVKSQKAAQFCGHAGLLATGTLDMQSVHEKLQFAITENGARTIAAIYLHLPSNNDDPAAIQSLQTLCADGVPPVTPSPSPTATP